MSNKIKIQTNKIKFITDLELSRIYSGRTNTHPDQMGNLNLQLTTKPMSRRTENNRPKNEQPKDGERKVANPQDGEPKADEPH
jgi:hypothetical protein